MTSFDVIRKLRKNLQIKKMGHTGTLDPLASGLLLIATGNSTKLIPLLESARKEYIATIELSGSSASLDRGTDIFPVSLESMKNPTDTEIEEFLLGLISQIPPQYSALHIDGRRAYELAREGIEFEIEERAIQVERVKVLSRSETSLTIEILVSSGCYIRSLAPVIWEFFGVRGWYLSSLERTRIYTEYGELSSEDVSEIENPKEISYSKLFPTFHTLNILPKTYKDILEWREVPVKEFSNNSIIEWQKLFLSYKETDFLSLGEIQDQKYKIIRNNV